MSLPIDDCVNNDALCAWPDDTPFWTPLTSGIGKRHRMLLNALYGFGRPMHSAEVAAQEGITKAQLYRTCGRCSEDIHSNIRANAGVIGAIEHGLSGSRIPAARISLRCAIALCRDASPSGCPCSDSELASLLLILRVCRRRQGTEVPGLYPRLTALAAAIRGTGYLPASAEPWAGSDERKHRTTHVDVAVAVLREAGTALHHSEIALRCSRIDPDRRSVRAIHCAVTDHKETFVCVGRGTFALAEWNAREIRTYVDIIAEVLATAGCPMRSLEIEERVNACRPIKRASLSKVLCDHPRFYRSAERTYGLRVWLPPREKLTARTSPCVVETPQSYLRLERATRRGYDVERLVARDRLDFSMTTIELT